MNIFREFMFIPEYIIKNGLEGREGIGLSLGTVFWFRLQ